MTKKFILFIIPLFFLTLFPSLSAITISGTNYSVGSSVSSFQGGNAMGYIYNARTYLTTNTGGSANNSLYNGIIGLFGKFKNPSLPPLTLSITSPRNGTYLDKQSIPLSYYAVSAESIWYSLDSEENITLTSSTYFNIDEGGHILYVYANDSNGEIITQNISFSVNENKFKIKYNKWKGDKKGNSTNITDYSFEELQNLSNLVLEDIDRGKIRLNQNINLTDDSDPEDKQIDIESFINISANRIEVNSTAIPNFNKSATLHLYNLNFVNPRILRDGSVCPDTICTGKTYSGGILEFNVTGFSVYSSEETPEVTTETPASTGGSSGAAIINTYIEKFIVDKEEIKISMTPGSIATKKITITNNGNKRINLNIKEEGLQDFLILKEDTIELNPNESKEIVFDIIIRENVLPDLYIGKFIISSENKKEVSLLIEVESKGALFDLRVNIPDEYLNVKTNSEILASIELFNLGEIKKADVEMEYIIEDYVGNKISTQRETIAVETKAGFVKRIKIPKDIKEGKYILYVRLLYNEKISSASQEFNVAGSSGFKLPLILIFLIIFFTVIIIILRYRRKSFILGRNISNYYKKINEFIRNLLNLNEKYSKDNIENLINKEVYSEMRHYIGKVNDVVLGENRIKYLKIELDKRYQFKARGITISYDHIKNIGDVIIIDEQIFKGITG